MTIKEFADGWKHFCECVDFANSALDGQAIRFMNEMPAAVAQGLTPDKVQPEPALAKKAENSL